MSTEEFDIHLASASPRRHELLTQIGVRFRLVNGEIAETPHPGEAAADFVTRMAVEKARAGQGNVTLHPERPVLGADTVVVIDNEILGKPHDKAHGLAMLARLSGRSHEVITAVALAAGTVHTALSLSKVTFRTVSAAEQEKYWQSGEPADKAGAYGIQGKAAIFITELQGSYSGVMGLPLCETAQLLQQAGIRLLR